MPELTKIYSLKDKKYRFMQNLNPIFVDTNNRIKS